MVVKKVIIPSNLGLDFRAFGTKYVNDNFVGGTVATPAAPPVETAKSWLYINTTTNKITHYWNPAGAAWVALVEPVVADFWRSGVGGTVLPDGTTDVADGIRRDGNVGLNADPLYNLDVNGSLGLAVRLTQAATDSFGATDTILIANGAATQTINFPSNLAPRRIWILSNPTAIAKPTTGLIDETGATIFGIPAFTTFFCVADGGNRRLLLRSTHPSAEASTWNRLTTTSASTNVADAIYHTGNVTVGDTTAALAKIHSVNTAANSSQGAFSFSNGTAVDEGTILSANGTITEIKLNNVNSGNFTISNDGAFKINNTNTSAAAYTPGINIATFLTNGNVGIGTTAPITTLDVNGSFGTNIVPTAAATYAFGPNDHTVVLTATTSQAVTLPPIGSQRRMVAVVNPTNVAKTFVTRQYQDLTGGFTLVIPANSSMILQSDGAGWVLLSKSTLDAAPSDFWRSGAGAVLPDGTTDTTDAITHVGKIGIGNPDPSTVIAGTEFRTGRASSGVVSGTVAPDVAFEFGSGGFRHFISTEHSSTAGDVANKVNLWLNNVATAAGSAAPGTGNVNPISIRPNNVVITDGVTAARSLTPASTLDVAGSFGTNITNTAAATYTILPADSTIYLSAATSQTVTLPAAAGNLRRILTITNVTATDKTFVGQTYQDIDGLQKLLIPANSTMILQGTGTGWVMRSKTLGNRYVTAAPAVANVTAPGQAVGQAVDYITIAIPTAGVWDVDFAVRGGVLVANGGLAAILTDSANAAVSPSVTCVFSATTTGVQATGVGKAQVTTTGPATYKVRIWSYSGPNTGAAVSIGFSGESWATARRVG
jgi:hypothetical protein